MTNVNINGIKSDVQNKDYKGAADKVKSAVTPASPGPVKKEECKDDSCKPESTSKKN